MKMLEYEAKNLLEKYGLATPEGKIWRVGETAPSAVRLPAMIKAQVPAGGRGRAGGVRSAVSEQELAADGAAMLGSELLGYPVTSVLIEEQLHPEDEIYLAIALDRGQQAFGLLAHKNGGIDIEEATGAPLELVLRGKPAAGQLRELTAYFELEEAAARPLENLVTNLWKLAAREDAVLVEINPLMVMADGRLVCADAKIELDDDAGFRHKDRQMETRSSSAQFVVLADTGTIASLANGAGLAMATNDAIKAAGAEPANFFDVGGGTSAEGMAAGFDKIRGLKDVKAIVVNIFAGITRCDEVAQAILAARAKGPTPPLFIRLAGTNAEAGKALLAEAGIELCGSLSECVERAAAEVRRV